MEHYICLFVFQIFFFCFSHWLNTNLDFIAHVCISFMIILIFVLNLLFLVDVVVVLFRCRNSTEPICDDVHFMANFFILLHFCGSVHLTLVQSLHRNNVIRYCFSPLYGYFTSLSYTKQNSWCNNLVGRCLTVWWGMIFWFWIAMYKIQGTICFPSRDLNIFSDRRAIESFKSKNYGADKC